MVFSHGITGQSGLQDYLRYRSLKLKLLLAILMACCGASSASAAPAFPLHTQGQYMVDSNGYRVRLNAFNWYGTESTDYVVAGLQTQSLSSIVTLIKSLGFN